MTLLATWVGYLLKGAYGDDGPTRHPMLLDAVLDFLARLFAETAAYFWEDR